jgi:hypothetical protein
MISGILITAAVTIMMAMLYSASKGKANENEQGQLLLQLPKFYWILGAFMIIVGIALLIAAMFHFDSNEDKVVVLCMSLVTLGFGYLLFGKGYISNIVISENEIIETSMFRKKTHINFNEIDNITFGKISLELSIKSKQKKIKAHIHLVGFRELVAKLSEKTGRTSIEMGIPIQ